MDKFIYDISQADLITHPVWYFPMDDSVSDETVVRPIQTDHISLDYRLIVVTDFVGKNGAAFMGYIYWGKPETIEVIQPVIVGTNSSITFWNGIRKPSKDYVQTVVRDFPQLVFPLEFRSRHINELSVIRGQLEGLYYLGEDDGVKCWPFASKNAHNENARIDGNGHFGAI